MWAQSM
jgi:hypothetical protein